MRTHVGRVLKKMLRDAVAAACLALLALLVVELFNFASSRMVRSPLQAMDDEVVDLSYHIRDTNENHRFVKPEDIVIIDIDDYSIEQMGRTQAWPRAYDAKVINYIASGNPKAIGIDYLYTESDSMSAAFLAQLEQNGVQNALEIGKAMSTDHLLSEAIDSAGCVYLAFFDDDQQKRDSSYTVSQWLSPLNNTRVEDGLSRWNYPVLPIESFASKAKRVGGLSVPTSYDGMVRSYQAVSRLNQGNVVANFPVYMMLDAKGIEPNEVTLTDGGIVHGDSLLVPLDKKGAFRLNWLGTKEKIRYISYYKVWDELMPAEFFEGKYVFMGASASGLQDLKTVPSRDDKMPGVEVHATAFLNMMNGAYLHDLSEGRVRMLYALLAFVMTVIFLSVHPFIGVILAFLFYFAFRFSFEMWILPTKHYVIPIALLMTLTLVCFVLSALYAFFIRERRARFLKSAFGTYVSPEIVNRISREGFGLQLGGEKKQLTVLFSDIRDFTYFSERFDSQQIVAFLNHYLSSMSEVIFKHQGTIDKFIGDAIMAIFGAPVPQQNHAEKACLVAIGMIENLDAVNTENMRLGFPKVSIGIGINTGDMTIGNIGSNRRFDYTVIGDAVNLGARLEGLTKFFDVPIIVSEYTRDAVRSSDLRFRELGNVIVKGKELPVKIYQLLTSINDSLELQVWLKHWEQAFDHMEAQQLPEAIESLKLCRAILSEDLATFYYLKSCEAYLDTPEKFDLLIRMESK